MKAKYINPFTDFGFKKLFGEEVNKDLLIDFLNGLLPQKHKIKDLTYKRTEHLGATEIDRKAIFDIYCESENGDRFIVELQKAKQNFFKDRAVFCSTFPIREQAERGSWTFELAAVYCVGILDFVFDDSRRNPHKYVERIQLRNEDCAVFYDKLTFIFVEMPKFNKKEDELETPFDKWLYFIKNLEDFEHIPPRLRNRIFEKAFQSAEIARFNLAQMDAYEQSLNYYRDMKNVIDTAVGEGFERGLEEGRQAGIQQGIQQGVEQGELKARLEVARTALAQGLSDELVMALTRLSPAQLTDAKK